MATLRFKALEEQHKKIENKMSKLVKFEDYLKKVQEKYSDEFTDLLEIITRYTRLDDANRLLNNRHVNS